MLKKIRNEKATSKPYLKMELKNPSNLKTKVHTIQNVPDHFESDYSKWSGTL